MLCLKSYECDLMEIVRGYMLLCTPRLAAKNKSDAASKELIAKYGTRDAYWVATVYAVRNQRDEAFEWRR